MENTRLPPWARTVYMELMRVYPRAVRQRFGDEMFEVFRNTWVAKCEAGERAVAVRMWARAVRDATTNGFAFRFRRTHRDRTGSNWSKLGWVVETLAQDARWAFRTMRRNPGFATVVVATFALGVGVNAAIFSVVDGVLLRPLPFLESDRLVRVWSADTAGGERFLQSTFAEVMGVMECL